MKEFVKVVLSAVLGLILLFSLIAWGDSTRCDKKTIGFEDNKWGVMSGCMVLHDGRWLPLDNYRF